MSYVDGPNAANREIFLACYRNDPSFDAVEAAADLATAIDYWLCGSSDDGDEGQEYILARAVERAARYIAAQPCACDMPDGDLCDRCVAIGCWYGEHRSEGCLSESGVHTPMGVDNSQRADDQVANGGHAVVDDEDFEHLSQWRWHRHPGGYAARTAHDRKVLMHREIIRPEQGLEVDHRNGDKLDNRRANLRAVDRTTNQRNNGPQSNNTSGFKGVTWDKTKRKWTAKTRHRGRDLHIGRFDSPEAAAAAYEQFVAGLS